jgi:hydrogenase nickel incorporation protein HypA/HybF
MVDELFRIARENNADKITIVKLRIGRMSGIVTDSLKFAFNAIKLEHPFLSSAEILIDEVPLRYECSDCKTAFNTDDFHFPTCPECNSYNLKILSGEEQHIESVEVEV